MFSQRGHAGIEQMHDIVQYIAATGWHHHHDVGYKVVNKQRNNEMTLRLHGNGFAADVHRHERSTTRPMGCQ
jgi:hypothetical protein